jgi:predicted signal transduction protein with EAL and GGDEF domain
VRQSDTVARLGGDEFVLVLSSLKDVAHAGYIADVLTRKLEAVFEIAGNAVHVGASIGIAIYPHDGDDFAALAKNADAAMYLAKQSGRGCFRFFTNAMDAANVRRLAVEVGLQTALEQDQLGLCYAPILDAHTRRLLGFEVLPHWAHPALGDISAEEFIPLAEENGTILAIGQWMLHTACAQLEAWQLAGRPHLKVSLNLTKRQLEHGALVGDTARVVDEYGLAPFQLGFEFAQDALAAGSDTTRRVLRKLREIGVGITVAGFGDGPCSISLLKKLPFQALKIDPALVRRATSDADDAKIIRATIAMAKRLGLQTIAPGVEHESQLDFLRRAGCDEAQGRYFAAPMTQEDADVFLQRGEPSLDAARSAPGSR